MQKKMITSLLLAGAMMLTDAFADSIKATPAALALVKKISQDNLTVLNTFAGPADLEGFVLQPNNGQPIIMYVEKQGQYAMYGTLIGKDGDNLTEQYNKQYAEKYIALKVADNLAETTLVKEGSDNAPYKVIVVADPNCSACHYSYNSMKPFIDKGELQVSWIFVYFVGSDSQAKAAAIMSAENPGKAMAENEAGFDLSKEKGGIAALTDIPKTIADDLEGNMKFMHDTGISSTPTLIFYDAKGQLQVVSGAPSDFAAFLKQTSPQIKQ